MNQSLFFTLYNLTGHSKIFDQVVFVIAEHADSLMILITIFAWLLFFVHDKDWKKCRWIEWGREVVIIGFSVLIAWLVTFFLKIGFHAPRPFVTYLQVHPLVIETPFTSFPSGHATVFFALAMAVYFYHKRLGCFFFVCAILIALSRIVAGVHYPGDIIVGACIGISIVYLSRYLFIKKQVK